MPAMLDPDAPPRRRLGLVELIHETNRSTPVPTALADFGLVAGDAVVAYALDRPRGVLAGAITAGVPAGWQPVGLVAGDAGSAGPLSAADWVELLARLDDALAAAGPLDAVIASLHGSFACEGEHDPDGHLAGRLREHLGPDRPLVVVADQHGNITPRLAGATDGLLAYRTNPHVDLRERGEEAVGLLEPERARTTYHRAPPMVVPTYRMRTGSGPFAELLALAEAEAAHPDLDAVALFGGWPLSDVPHAGPSVVVTARAAAPAEAALERLAAAFWDRREDFRAELLDAGQAVEAARSWLEGSPSGGPLVLADTSDNPSGGGSGDTTHLLGALHAAGVPLVAACVCDVPAVQAAHAAGVGAQLDTTLGGRHDTGAGAPLPGPWRVVALHRGAFTANGPMHGGRLDAGLMALLEQRETQVVAVERRAAPEDTAFLEVLGLDPRAPRVLLLKSRGHFRAAFEPLADTVLEAGGPGPTAQDLAAVTFRHLRRPVWPLDADGEPAAGTRS
jgi:microcystin degradation protein MlrC